MASDIKLGNETIDLIGDVDVTGRLRISASDVRSVGPLAGYLFVDRMNPAGESGASRGDRFVLYATDKSARIWSEGDMLTLNWMPNGSSAKLEVLGIVQAGEVVIKDAGGGPTHFVGLELKAHGKRLKKLEEAVAALSKK